MRKTARKHSRTFTRGEGITFTNSKGTGLHARFCRCIKAVSSQKPGKTRKQKRNAEKSAIAICVSSVIQRLPRRTLHSFRCKDTRQQHAFIRTQKRKKRFI